MKELEQSGEDTTLSSELRNFKHLCQAYQFLGEFVDLIDFSKIKYFKSEFSSNRISIRFPKWYSLNVGFFLDENFGPRLFFRLYDDIDSVMSHLSFKEEELFVDNFAPQELIEAVEKRLGFKISKSAKDTQ